MMAGGYEVVPYTISINVKGAASDLRPIGNLDAKRLTLQQAISKIYVSAINKSLESQSDDEKRMRIKSITRGKNSIFANVEPGISGIQSIFDDDSGEILFKRNPQHIENLPLRQAFVMPPGATFAWLFIERVRGIGSVSLTSALLKQNLRAMLGEVTVNILPAMDGELLRNSISQSPVKSFRFVLAGSKNAQGKYGAISGNAPGLELSFKSPRKPWKLPQLARNKNNPQPTQLDMLGYLVPMLRPGTAQADYDKAAQELLDEGWQAVLEVVVNGKSRSVKVGTEKARDMAFPMVDDRGSVIVGRPSDQEFKATCESVLEAFAGKYGLPTTGASLVTWDTEALSESDQGWELRWG